MNITLRKANALQTVIQEHIKSIDVSLNVTLNEFQTVEEVNKARAKTVANDKRRADLTAAVYAIRGVIGDANATAGVSGLLAKAAYVDKRIGQLKALAESDATEDLDIVTAKLSKIKNDKNERSYGYRDTVTVNVLSQEQIAQYKVDLQALRKEKQTINDKVLELNIRTEIQLDVDVVAILQTEGLI